MKEENWREEKRWTTIIQKIKPKKDIPEVASFMQLCMKKKKEI